MTQRLSPAHFTRDDLVALRIVEILLEQFHIFLSLMVLLRRNVPVVFIPRVVGLELVPGIFPL